MAAKIKKGDKVIVLAGRDKGKRGEVRQVMPTEGRAIVAGVNLVRRHTRQTAQTEGGIITKEVDDPSVESGDRRSQDRQAHARRLQDSRRRPQGARRQAFRRPDRWLRRRAQKGEQGRQARQD